MAENYKTVYPFRGSAEAPNRRHPAQHLQLRTRSQPVAGVVLRASRRTEEGQAATCPVDREEVAGRVMLKINQLLLFCSKKLE